MAEINFGNSSSPESFMLPTDGQYMVHSDESLQALVFPCIAFDTGERTDDEHSKICETLDYLQERELWIAASIDASSNTINSDNVAYKITSSRTSEYGRVVNAIREDEAAGNLPVGSLATARSALIECAFEDHPLFDRYMRKVMDGPATDWQT